MEINHHETSPGVFEPISMEEMEDFAENLTILLSEDHFTLTHHTKQYEGITWSKDTIIDGTYLQEKDSLILTTSKIRVIEDVRYWNTPGTEHGKDRHTDVTHNIVKVFSVPLKVMNGKRIIGPLNINKSTLLTEDID